MRSLFFLNLEDVDAVHGFDQTAHFARLQRKRHGVEFRHRLLVNKPAKLAARLSRAVFGVLLSEFTKVAAGANLVQNIGGRLFNRRDFGRRLASGLKQNVGNPHAVGNTVIGKVLGIVLP